MNASDLMTDEVETVHEDDDISDVLTRLARADFNGFPVVDDDDRVVGIVTQHDLVHIFQPSDRTLWIPVGFPPFLETLEYAIDLSWDDLDTELDLLKHAGKPVRTVMTEDVVTVGPDADFDRILDLLADDERDINRLPVVDEDGKLLGIVARQDVLRAVRDERRAKAESGL
ncbi:CBS domain-containing protein [Halorussus gelatinilyticus]|uniref:CBS domain-containing protein n=1 Tax=Halorussus gelatinilyticus TaxID=2937524 RepID=A0A8U0ILQ1_9EURY|nr:CBS domain-containing protein [Halorussus gelatinilyticus]UPW00959.1 CBS domain-containing protein [Halorussus gelatinilyticus]